MNALRRDQQCIDAIGRLEAVARRDPGARGLSSAAPDGLLLPAARAMADCRRVIIVTGFCVRSAMVGETDGPPGATGLAAVMERLGATVMLLTDRFSAGLVKAACAARQISPAVELLPDRDCLALAADFRPDLVLAIERPGTAADGHRYSMRGAILDDIAPAADALFAPGGQPVGVGSNGLSSRATPTGQLSWTAPSGLSSPATPTGQLSWTAPTGLSSPATPTGQRPGTMPTGQLSWTAPTGQRPWTTLAIGDGGNELGMGSLRAACAVAVPLGERIFCDSPADYPLVAGTSNWGAYALAGAIALLTGQRLVGQRLVGQGLVGQRLVDPPATELAVLAAICQAGAVDGCTRAATVSVDGLSAAEYAQSLTDIHNIILESL
jgi:hypothetical protein